MESLDILGRKQSMVKNILEDVVYIEPDLTLPPADGMCKDCIELNLQDMCNDCKEQVES